MADWAEVFTTEARKITEFFFQVFRVFRVSAVNT